MDWSHMNGWAITFGVGMVIMVIGFINTLKDNWYYEQRYVEVKSKLEEANTIIEIKESHLILHKIENKSIKDQNREIIEEYKQHKEKNMKKSIKLPAKHGRMIPFQNKDKSWSYKKRYANGQCPNHKYNTKQGLYRGMKAEANTIWVISE